MLKSAIPVVHVTKSEGAEHFFDKLGFRREFAWRPDESKADPCYMGFKRDDVLLHVSSFPDGCPGGAVYVYVENLDALHEEFVARGVRIDSGPVDQNWGTREMWVKDADRNTITFGQRRQ